jgi:outer membrane protein
MKTKSLIFSFLLLASSLTGAFAQGNIKIGYTDPEYILSMMPKYKQVESELKSYEKQLQSQLDSKLKEYQGKLEIYQKDINNLTDLVKQDKEKELIGMQTSIKEFEENALSSMQKRQGVLLDPLIKEVQDAIDVVAKENDFTYIFSTSAGSNAAIILYAKNKEEDISELVLKKLGVTVPAKSETGISNPTNTTPNNTVTKPAPTTTNPGTGAPVKKK